MPIQYLASLYYEIIADKSESGMQSLLELFESGAYQNTALKAALKKLLADKPVTFTANDAAAAQLYARIMAALNEG